VGSSVLTGSAVSAAGSIGFIGLVTPHLVRLALGSDNRVVLPVSALLGGVLLMAADLAARVLIAPRQLPVGALTALVGVPLFLLLMYRQRS
jgi:iron complex transport system permease protein